MCGLAGILGPSAADPATRSAFAAALAHRGPDAEGQWADPVVGVALMHRRLSILDLSSGGAQPMVSADGRWVLVFNGEIYDHAALRARLEAEAPRRWRGHSDTEVLLEAIAAWGVDATLARCNGMFALAAWDRIESRLVLARDCTGEKPLYVGAVGGDLVFASELKAFRRHPAWRHAVEPRALGWLLELGYVPAPWSIHPKVFKLPAGTLLRLGPSDADWWPDAAAFASRAERWWRLEDVVAEARDLRWQGSENDALRELRGLIDDAVALRMEADVPVGALLSSGIDSTLVVASMARQSPRPVRTFTVGFDAPGLDESDAAAAIARYLGTEHRHLPLAAHDALDLVECLPRVYDEPFADVAQVPALLVARAARREVAVALTGDGGDEVFQGYQRYLDAERVWNVIGGWPSGARTGVAALLRGASRLLPPGCMSRRLLRQGVRLGAGNIDDYGRALMRFDGAQAVDAKHDPAWMSPPAALDGATPGERLRWRDQAVALPEGIHAKLDRASMAFSLELRVPLLDPRLLALAWRMPAAWHARDGVGKRMLRRLVEDVAPAGISTRRKQGFDVPLSAWLRGPLRDWAEALLAPAALACEPLLDAGHVRALWRDHLSGRADHGHALWALLMYRTWSDRHG